MIDQYIVVNKSGHLLVLPGVPRPRHARQLCPRGPHCHGPVVTDIDIK